MSTCVDPATRALGPKDRIHQPPNPDTGTHIGEPQIERPDHEGEEDVDVQDEGQRHEERRAAGEGVEAADEGRVEEAFVLCFGFGFGFGWVSSLGIGGVCVWWVCFGGR